ncbi:MAG: hypothetical protein DU429_05685 [Candidatus Tokpelaia sp.]|nr:MAG: hypothetical protein DU430_07565 [Candidatus Tokpelaia sp.]KAA6206718.1 MAG: hypothetical protein DU429_05685 [Candidatus Tokpelaia sp.]
MDYTATLYNYILSFLQKTNSIGFPIPSWILLVLMAWLVIRSAAWDKKENYYLILLKNIDIWKNTLSGKLSFFDYPGACHDQDYITKNEHYKNLAGKGRCARVAIQDSMGEGRLFLPQKAIQAVDKLLSENNILAE